MVSGPESADPGRHGRPGLGLDADFALAATVSGDRPLARDRRHCAVLRLYPVHHSDLEQLYCRPPRPTRARRLLRPTRHNHGEPELRRAVRGGMALESLAASRPRLGRLRGHLHAGGSGAPVFSHGLVHCGRRASHVSCRHYAQFSDVPRRHKPELSPLSPLLGSDARRGVDRRPVFCPLHAAGPPPRGPRRCGETRPRRPQASGGNSSHWGHGDGLPIDSATKRCCR